MTAWAAIAAPFGGPSDNATLTPIKHVIVIVGENRSVDHVFGTGGRLGQNKPLDGMHVWSTISAGAFSSGIEVASNMDPFLPAVRRDDRKRVWHALLPGCIELFDLHANPSEKRDLSDQDPEKVKELQGRIQDLAEQMAKPLVLADAFSLMLEPPPSTPLEPIEDYG